jgi:TonB-dependent receptor
VNLNPGDADVDLSRKDLLPSIGLVWEPLDEIALRGSYSETVARPIFKELTPIIQQEFTGGPIFIGNPELQMSALKNYDLRLDYKPYAGGLFSVSWFHKEVEDPIEYVQKISPSFTYTTAENYPDGKLTGWELELRQDVGNFWETMQGFSLGANATFIKSKVNLSDEESAVFDELGIEAPMSSRDMTGAPERLLNFYLTYDYEKWGTRAALFYTLTGDTLIAGATGVNGKYVPNVYATEYGTLNLSLSQQLWKYVKLTFKAKNLTNPKIETVYRSDYIGADVKKTSYTRGVDYSIALTVEIPF